jgi:hypothetical protein
MESERNFVNYSEWLNSVPAEIRGDPELASLAAKSDLIKNVPTP